MSKECTTHHFACDCREEKFKQLEQENAALRDTVEQWKCRYYDVADAICRESTGIEDLCRQARALRAENAALREDKERLDWLDHNAIPWNWLSPELIDGLGPIVVTWKSNRTLRAVIDAARKEVQP